MLEGPGEVLLEHTLCFNFQANNNQKEYEVIIVGIKLALEVGALRLSSIIDFQLVIN